MVVSEIVGNFLAKIIDNNEYLFAALKKWQGIEMGHLYSQFSIIKIY